MKSLCHFAFPFGFFDFFDLVPEDPGKRIRSCHVHKVLSGIFVIDCIRNPRCVVFTGQK
jgi:hypothetical protein